MDRGMRCAAALLSVLGVLTWGAVAQDGQGAPQVDRPPEVDLFGGATYPGGHLKYSYKVTREGVEGHSITTTEIIPQGDGMYRVESSSSDLVPDGMVNISFFGIGLRGLGFRIPTSTGGTVDLSPLSALELEALEPNRDYILPDGGFLAAGEAGTIAGVEVVFATFTHADFSNVVVRLAMPTDLTIRTLLPLFPYLSLEYSAGQPTEEEETQPRMRSFSTIELIEFIYEP